MADFVAVIRRAVDGLSNNTPDMRAKVYEKARGAVQRQLENMKPRPPEDMLRRQMDKLEAAIQQVEGEHAEALPAEEAVVAAPVVQAVPIAEPAVTHEPDEQPPALVEQEPVAEEPAEAAPVHEERYDDREPAAEIPVVREASAAEEEVTETAPPRYGDWREDLPQEQSEPEAEDDRYEPHHTLDHRSDHPAPLSATGPVVADPISHAPAAIEPDDADFPYPTRGGEPAVEHHYEPPAAAPEWLTQPAVVETSTPAPRGQADDWGWEAEPVAAGAQAHPAALPAAGKPADMSAAWDDVPDLVAAGPTEPISLGSKGEAVEAHFDQETHVAADTVRMPSVSELPDLPPVAGTAAAASADPFADYLDPKPKAGGKPTESDPWGDLEDLIGFNKGAPLPDGSSRGSLHSEADADDLMPTPARPYRVTPVRKRNYAGILLGIVGLAVVGGGGYAIWLNRDSLNDMVDGLIESSLPSSGGTAQQAPTPAPSAPRPSTPQASTPAAAPATAPATQGNASGATPPRPTDGTTATKFTQRLNTDGSETNPGPGGATAGLAQNTEGQSVARLNVPPATPPAASTPATPAAPATPATPTPNNTSAQATPAPSTPTPSATPSTTPAVSGEKIFLYEERVGQSAPTAIDGSVSWALQREPAQSGRQEPVIQGRITVPGRGLTALVTIKRNTDPSLPASHLIEIVFALPPDFEGGAIDSVQRIALKSTEQDRGNALIAVPAKITDDFHMIALNDFPDARTTNLELLRSRNWIDIPVAYRNGRRALLTLQKGSNGERVFNDAIREWTTLGATANGQ